MRIPNARGVVAQHIGVLETIGLLFLITIVGVWLVKRQGVERSPPGSNLGTRERVAGRDSSRSCRHRLPL